MMVPQKDRSRLVCTGYAKCFVNSTEGTEWNKSKLKKDESGARMITKYFAIQEELKCLGRLLEADGLSEMSRQAAPDLQREDFHQWWQGCKSNEGRRQKISHV